MDNLELYNAVKSVPDEAIKPILGGKLKGKSDINPMWRIKKLTEQFGPCGKGWKPEIVRTWIDDGANGEKVVNVQINLYVKFKGETEWSAPIFGIGGNTLVQLEKGQLVTNDEAYKMAYTDALSVACKALGFAADVYFDKDKTKYDKEETPPQVGSRQQAGKSKWAQINDIIKDSDIGMPQITEWIIKKFGKNIRINDLTDEQFSTLFASLRKQLGGGDE